MVGQTTAGQGLFIKFDQGKVSLTLLLELEAEG